MNGWWLAAAALLVLIGIVHSVLGERLIFRHLRAGTLVPEAGAPVLRAYQTRILWGSWHLASVFGWTLAAVLAWRAGPGHAEGGSALEMAVAAGLIAASALAAWATRGRHIGWVALLAAAALVLAGLLQR
ncbi:MAG: hypothetical protein EKK52_10730 [Burkholderiales bacterium]|uniref:hypothetical protein n=1 Tax=Roseateles sp. TaxID=1971397 RepID=UPI000FB75855|nr:MAG: hypothetical protein EKK52_10730 [Burkholderiales bacterium]